MPVPVQVGLVKLPMPLRIMSEMSSSAVADGVLTIRSLLARSSVPKYVRNDAEYGPAGKGEAVLAAIDSEPTLLVPELEPDGAPAALGLMLTLANVLELSPASVRAPP